MNTLVQIAAIHRCRNCNQLISGGTAIRLGDRFGYIHVGCASDDTAKDAQS